MSTCQASTLALRQLLPTSCFYDRAKFIFVLDQATEGKAMPAAWKAHSLRYAYVFLSGMQLFLSRILETRR